MRRSENVREQGCRVPRIVAGVDGLPSSIETLRWADRQSGLTGSTVDAVTGWLLPVGSCGHGWAPTGIADGVDYGVTAEKMLTDAITAAVGAGNDVTIRPLVVQGHPAQGLLQAADGADLLVVGSREHCGFAGALLGSVSQQRLHNALPRCRDPRSSP